MADVKGDRECYLYEPPLSVGTDDAFIIANSHHNSNQGYLITALFHIHGGRIRKIAEVFTLSVNSGTCETSFTENLDWSTEKDEGSPYLKVIAKVTLTTGPPEDMSCDSSKRFKRSTKVYNETYRWNNAKDRFITDGKGFKELDRFNEKNL